MKRVTVERKGPSMSTTVLAYLILFMGFITFLAGAFGALMLLFEEVAKTVRVPFRYYAMMVNTPGCVIWLTESESQRRRAVCRTIAWAEPM